MNIAGAIIICLLTLLTIGLLIYAVYLKLSHRYTRERYAFAALAGTISIATLTITSLTSAPPWFGFLQVYTIVFNKPIPLDSQPHWAERLLIFTFAMFTIWIINKAFGNWDGAISERQHEQSRFHESTNIFYEGVSEICRIAKGLPPPNLYQRPDYTLKYPALQAPVHDLVWRDHARELFELIRLLPLLCK